MMLYFQLKIFVPVMVVFFPQPPRDEQCWELYLDRPYPEAEAFDRSGGLGEDHLAFPPPLSAPMTTMDKVAAAKIPSEQKSS